MSMKAMLLCCLMAVWVISGYAQQKSPKIEGAWQLVSAKSVEGKSTYVFPGDWNGSQMKLWTKNHFAFVGVLKAKQDTATFNNSGGGTYKLTGNRYVETIKYHSDKSSVDKTIKMNIEIKNDTLIQTWPVDEKGKIDPANYNIEKYIRL